MNLALVNRVIVIILIIGSLVASGIFVDSARKEVLYLCGNFSEGVAKASVIRQLNTGDLLDYEEFEVDTGSKIHVSSLFTLNIVTCNIEFDKNDLVIQSTRSHEP
ncbi:hypothetical protein PN836_010165 [Ningiella sp. W23]|uniref:hypothetical protein n=1 Tax=Ningiella sp. W23 TaxID=3023715 RepID=UPI0037573E74